jgi:hypothetical protein
MPACGAPPLCDARAMATRLIPALILLLTAAPAFAAGTQAVPEAPAATLFALGLLGVIVGRRASMKQKDKGEE